MYTNPQELNVLRGDLIKYVKRVFSIYINKVTKDVPDV